VSTRMERPGVAFDEWLKEALKRRRMSQRQLAYFSGIDHSTVSRLASGDRTPNLDTAIRLRAILRADCICGIPKPEVG
jgi:transcriptional regulator with XRE-family HTH domain